MINEIVCPKQIKKSQILFSISANHQLCVHCVLAPRPKRAHNDVVTLTNKGRFSVISIEIKEFSHQQRFYTVFPTNQWHHDIYIWWMSTQSRSAHKACQELRRRNNNIEWIQKNERLHGGNPFVILLSTNVCFHFINSKIQNVSFGFVLDCGFTLPIRISPAECNRCFVYFVIHSCYGCRHKY